METNGRALKNKEWFKAKTRECFFIIIRFCLVIYIFVKYDTRGEMLLSSIYFTASNILR